MSGTLAAKNTGSGASFQAPWPVFWVAFLVRVLYLTLAHTFRIRPYDGHFQFGWEMGRIASALATGQGFSNPFRGQTGPTAWVAPLFPLLLAGVFKIFGVFTLKSAWVILTIDSFFSALTTRPIWEIGARCFNLRVAKWSAWIWALYPAAMQYAVRWVWEMTLTTLLFSCVLVLALRMRDIGGDSASAQPASRSSKRRWAAFGLLWGLIGLSNPELLIFLPVCGLWVLGGVASWRRQLSAVVLAALVFACCLAPWAWRNWNVFGRFVPMRSNFGAELYLGNGPGSTGLLMEYDQPMQAPDQMRLYAKMGEIAYSKMRGEQAMTIIRRDPGHFVRDTMKRVFFFWASVPQPGQSLLVGYGRDLNFVFTSLCGLLGLTLALHRRIPAAGLFGWAFVLLPLVYYLVTTQARFRHPLEPLIAIFGVYLFQAAERSKRAVPAPREAAVASVAPHVDQS